MNGLYVKQENCVGNPIFYKLYRKLFRHSNEIDPCVSWALMREYATKGGLSEEGFPLPIYSEADLMMIYTHEKGQGLGLELLKRLQDRYLIIRTSWSGSTKEGRELCLKAGFVREGDLLIWRKNEKHEDDAKAGDVKEEGSGVHVLAQEAVRGEHEADDGRGEGGNEKENERGA